MSVLIKGLEMPETEYMDVRIFRDGTATIATGTKPYYRELKAEPVKHEECEYVITKGKAGYREEYKCSACGDSFYWTQGAIPRGFNYCRNCGRQVIRFIEEEVNTVRRESE